MDSSQSASKDCEVSTLQKLSNTLAMFHHEFSAESNSEREFVKAIPTERQSFIRTMEMLLQTTQQVSVEELCHQLMVECDYFDVHPTLYYHLMSSLALRLSIDDQVELPMEFYKWLRENYSPNTPFGRFRSRLAIFCQFLLSHQHRDLTWNDIERNHTLSVGNAGFRLMAMKYQADFTRFSYDYKIYTHDWIRRPLKPHEFKWNSQLLEKIEALHQEHAKKKAQIKEAMAKGDMRVLISKPLLDWQLYIFGSSVAAILCDHQYGPSETSDIDMILSLDQKLRRERRKVLQKQFAEQLNLTPVISADSVKKEAEEDKSITSDDGTDDPEEEWEPPLSYGRIVATYTSKSDTDDVQQPKSRVVSKVQILEGRHERDLILPYCSDATHLLCHIEYDTESQQFELIAHRLAIESARRRQTFMLGASSFFRTMMAQKHQHKVRETDPVSYCYHGCVQLKEEIAEALEKRRLKYLKNGFQVMDL